MNNASALGRLCFHRERLNREIKRRTDVAGIAAIRPLLYRAETNDRFASTW